MTVPSDMARNVAVLALCGCARKPPADLVPLASVSSDPRIERRAADWAMPVADARAYLESSDAGCPSPTSQLSASACLHAPPGRGLSADVPLAWGAAATDGGALWFDRLRCTDGATPEVVQASAVVWEVSCPLDMAPAQWFVDSETCGSPCPPEGVSVMPVDAANLERQASAALAEERTGDALHFVGMSISRYPHYASTWRIAGLARAATGDHAGALEAFRTTLYLDPRDGRAAYYAVRAAHSAEAWEEARDRAAELAPLLAGSPEVQAEVQCVEAVSRLNLGDASGAPLAIQACAAGASGCCAVEPGADLP